MAEISEGGGTHGVRGSLFIFSLRNKTIRAKEKRSSCGPGWLDPGERGGTQPEMG